MPPHLILASIFSFVAVGAYAGEWANLGTTSTTEPAHLCDIVVSPGGHHDIDCSGNNPEIIANGAISATGISTTSLFVNGTEITGSGGGGGSADQVISGTTNITANEDSSISFTTAGTERMILTDSGQLALGEGTADPSAILDISTTTQGVLPPRLTTAQRDNISNPAEGLMIFNAEQGAYQFWANSNWVDLGAGMPNGAIAAFASASCPSGWSEYTPARGRFLRGIDPTGTLDPDGVRTPGSTQADMIGQHQHLSPFSYNPGTNPYGFEGTLDPGVAREVTDQSESSDDQPYTSNFGGAETRPVNVAVTFCQYDGGAQLVATPSGSAGEVQFADGSGGLSSNANFIYSGGNLGVNTATPQTTLEVGGTISTSSLFVNGTEITGGGGGGGSINFEDFAEQSPDPANPAADTMRLFARDDGNGNTELVAVDSSGNEFTITGRAKAWQSASTVSINSSIETLVSNLPDDVEEIEIRIWGDPDPGTSNSEVWLRFGDDGGIETSGYDGAAQASNRDVLTSTSFVALLHDIDAGESFNMFAKMRLVDKSSNFWVVHGFTLSDNGGGVPSYFWGSKSLSDSIREIQFRTDTGSSWGGGGDAKVWYR